MLDIEEKYVSERLPILLTLLDLQLCLLSLIYGSGIINPEMARAPCWHGNVRPQIEDSDVHRMPISESEWVEGLPSPQSVTTDEYARARDAQSMRSLRCFAE